MRNWELHFFGWTASENRTRPVQSPTAHYTIFQVKYKFKAFPSIKKRIFRERLTLFLPAHVRRSTWSWLPVLSKKNSVEMKIMEQYKRVPPSTPVKKLILKYLEFARALPFYGYVFTAIIEKTCYDYLTLKLCLLPRSNWATSPGANIINHPPGSSSTRGYQRARHLRDRSRSMRTLHFSRKDMLQKFIFFFRFFK